MSDLKSLRELYGEPDIDSFAHARLRARLHRDMRRRRWSWKAATAGVTTAALIAGAVVVVVVPGVSERLGLRRETTISASTLATKREMLDEAAARAEAAPATGTYWHVTSFSHYTFPKAMGPEGNGYWLEEGEVQEVWRARDGAAWLGHRDLGVWPKTSADEAAWRRDGSPKQWDKTREPELVSRLSGEPDEGSVLQMDKGEPENRVFSLASTDVTSAELQSLPTDPAALIDWVKRTLREENPAYKDDGYDLALVLARQLLLDLPAPPKVRAAAFRALAELPNVGFNGAVKDDWGREAYEIEVTNRSGENDVGVLVDPHTARILGINFWNGVSTPGVSPRKIIYVQSGWTDARPSVPAIPKDYRTLLF